MDLHVAQLNSREGEAMCQRTEQKQMKARERPDCPWSQTPFYQHWGKDASFFQQRSRADNNTERSVFFFSKY